MSDTRSCQVLGVFLVLSFRQGSGLKRVRLLARLWVNVQDTDAWPFTLDVWPVFGLETKTDFLAVPIGSQSPILSNDRLRIGLVQLQRLVAALEVEQVNVNVLLPVFVFERFEILDAVNCYRQEIAPRLFKGCLQDDVVEEPGI